MLSLWLNVRYPDGLRSGLADSRGRLCSLWRWARQNSAVAVVLIASVRGVDRCVGFSGFADPAVATGIWEAIKLGELCQGRGRNGQYQHDAERQGARLLQGRQRCCARPTVWAIIVRLVQVARLQE